MRKQVAAISVLAFVLFISAPAYANDSSSVDFSLSKNNQGFSLTKTYNVTFSSLEMNSAKLREALFSFQDTQKAESIQAEINHLKKRRTTSLITTIGFIALGSFLVYEYDRYSTAVRETQEGGTQGVDEGRSNTSFGKGLRLGGAALSFIISAVLISDTIKKSKAIKQHKKELEALAAAQGR